MTETLKNPMVWLGGAGFITALYALLFPDTLLNVYQDIIRGVPGSTDDVTEDFTETKETPCTKCRERPGVVIVDLKLLCAECAIREQRR